MRAHVAIGHGRRHGSNHIILVSLINQVDPEWKGDLFAKYDAVAP